MGPADTSIIDPIRCARACARTPHCPAASLRPGIHCTLGIWWADRPTDDLQKPAKDEVYVLVANGGGKDFANGRD